MVRFLAASAFAVLSALTFAAPSQALSCLPPSPEDSFAHYQAAPELYQIWTGKWIKTNATPEINGYVDPVTGTMPFPVMYQFRGKRVGQNGTYGNVKRIRVLVDPQCAGPWCANYPEGGDKIVGFFEVTGQSFRKFTPGACGGASFEQTAQNINRLASCFNSGACN